MEMTRQPARYARVRQRRQANQWEVIRAARAFFGRPLGLEELRKIHAAQELQAGSDAGLQVGGPFGLQVGSERAGVEHVQHVHRARERDIEQAPVEGAA